MKNNFYNYLELGKIKIMLPVSLTGFTGYFIFKPEISPKILLISFGILLLAISASVLNQIQEIDLDSKMKRTHDRPLPAKKISLKHAILFLLLNFIAGISIIYLFGNIISALIGLITILWYNGIYTYAKRVSAFAVFPGAITGALPPLIGWTAAGGNFYDKPIILLGFLLFIGQMPHFWLIIMKYGKEYQEAGIPSLSNYFTPTQINRLTFIWVFVSVVSALFLCYFEIIISKALIIILIAASIYLIYLFTDLLKVSSKPIIFSKYFILLNSYFLLVLLLLISDKILFR